jgi:hypothetical protein
LRSFARGMPCSSLNATAEKLQFVHASPRHLLAFLCSAIHVHTMLGPLTILHHIHSHIAGEETSWKQSSTSGDMGERDIILKEGGRINVVKK